MKVSKKHAGVHLYKGKKDFIYYISYRANGKLIWERIGKHSEGVREINASNTRNRRLNEIHERKFFQTDTLTLDEGFELFKNWLLTEERVSVDTDVARYNKHLMPYLGSLKMAKITKAHVETVRQKEWNYLSRGSQFQIIMLIKRIYNRLKKLGMYHGENPLNGYENPKVNKYVKQRFLTFEEAHTLLDALEICNQTTFFIAKISLLTGMRLSEILRLEGRNVSLEYNTMSFRTKSLSGKEIRSVRIPKGILEILETVKEEHVNGKLFPKRFNKELFRKVVNDIGLNEGVPAGRKGTRDRVTFHTLRHSHASWQAMQGVSMPVLQQLLGHKDPRTTNIYTHLSEQIIQQAVDHLSDTFERHAPKERKLLPFPTSSEK